MATAEQIKALLKSHADHDDDRFYSIALQVAAKEARAGHHKIAHEIKSLVEKAQESQKLGTATKPTPITQQPKGELNGLLDVSYTAIHKSELVLSEETMSHLDRIIFEQRHNEKLSQFGLFPRRKVLFIGPPGTGKTMSAAVLATELKLPLYRIVLDSLITRYMGETATKLRLIFDHIKQTRAVYLFDEFDAIGTQRGATNDVGEIRRVLNSFLLFVEEDNSQSIIVAATNHPELLDKALYRRFDDIIHFDKPHGNQIKHIIENRLAKFELTAIDWDNIVKIADGLSSAEITRASEDAAKQTILKHESQISSHSLMEAIKYRQAGKY